MNRFHLVPLVTEIYTMEWKRYLTLEAIHGMLIGVNNQAMPYTPDTGEGITYKQPSLILQKCVVMVVVQFGHFTTMRFSHSVQLCFNCQASNPLIVRTIGCAK